MQSVREVRASAGDLVIDASNAASIHATAIAAAVAITGGGTNGVGVSGGAAVSTNVIDVDVFSYAKDSALNQFGTTDEVKVAAGSTAAITAEILAASAALALGGTNGIAVSIGVSVAINRIGDWTVQQAENMAPDDNDGDQDPEHTGQYAPTGVATLGTGSVVKAYLENTSVDAQGALTVEAISGGVDQCDRRGALGGAGRRRARPGSRPAAPASMCSTMLPSRPRPMPTTARAPRTSSPARWPSRPRTSR